MANTIDSSLYLENYKKAERKTGSDILGKDDFLKILMVQLQNQDPLNPMQDKDFIAQMATFSSLEQMTNMNKTMEKFVNSASGDLMLKYSSMIGKEVEWSYTEKPTTEDGEPTTKKGKGIVTSVRMKDGAVELELNDGTKIYSDEIVVVRNPSE